MNFPKNIFQTWKTKEVPEQWKNSQQSVISKNPTWNYNLYTDEQNDSFVKEKFPDFYSTYISFKYPIQRVDAVRYCLLYIYGGIYLDLDYICNKSFDDITLISDVALMKSNNTKGIFTNSVLISQPKSEFWLILIEEMKKGLPWYLRLTKHFEIMNSTGPLLVNKISKQNKVQTLTNFSTPCNVCEIKQCEVSNKYYVTPIEGQTWNSWDTLVLNYIYCNKSLIFSFIILLILVKLICSLKVK